MRISCCTFAWHVNLKAILALLSQGWGQQVQGSWGQGFDILACTDLLAGSINYVHLHLLWGVFRSLHLVPAFSRQLWDQFPAPRPNFQLACLEKQVWHDPPHTPTHTYPHWYSWNSAGLAKRDWISPEQGSCVFLYTFHHCCQLMSWGQLVIYDPGFDASRIPSQTLWSKKGGWRAQEPSCHQTKGSEACDSVHFCSADNSPDGSSARHPCTCSCGPTQYIQWPDIQGRPLVRQVLWVHWGPGRHSSCSPRMDSLWEQDSHSVNNNTNRHVIAAKMSSTRNTEAKKYLQRLWWNRGLEHHREGNIMLKPEKTGLVVNNPPASAEGWGSIPGPGWSHGPQGN